MPKVKDVQTDLENAARQQLYWKLIKSRSEVKVNVKGQGCMTDLENAARQTKDKLYL